MHISASTIHINYRDLGILNNQGFLQNYITENPLMLATVKFASINNDL